MNIFSNYAQNIDWIIISCFSSSINLYDQCISWVCSKANCNDSFASSHTQTLWCFLKYDKLKPFWRFWILHDVSIHRDEMTPSLHYSSEIWHPFITSLSFIIMVNSRFILACEVLYHSFLYCKQKGLHPQKKQQQHKYNQYFSWRSLLIRTSVPHILIFKKTTEQFSSNGGKGWLLI